MEYIRAILLRPFQRFGQRRFEFHSLTRDNDRLKALQRFGLERIREIARENGKKGGRPPKKEVQR